MLFYFRWVKFTGAPDYTPDWKMNAGTELYDHAVDPEENHNVADSAHYHETRAQLSEMLRAGWRDAMPKHQTDIP